ncbi:MAG: FAD-dependent oxidoreductase [Woeseia sp.]|jgi:pyruvate/2-oxoglutarate dehydrogenase complex dihydrolipoamide dehydrogenase (E3) component|nr:FAD-dependent oxidoreductase [Woeseia sp.]MBT6211327.1 FAD-dependent oxidoreductase [Woeseia sp.]
MNAPITTDICVIGAGSGGLSVAAGAVQMGAEVVLIEKDKMGGDCLNTGCVPSKALLAAGKHAQAFRTSGPFGIKPATPDIDFAAAMAHVREVIQGIEPHDSVERFESLGVNVIKGAARFTSRNEVAVGEQRIRAKRFVIATGSRATVPPIPGIDETDYLTNETLFENSACPDHLIIVGGGPIGIEMAQAHHRLGAKVTILERMRALPNDDPDLAAIVVKSLLDEGVSIREEVNIASVSGKTGDVRVTLQDGEEIRGSHLLMATGRAPGVADLGLDEAGIQYSRSGVEVDSRLRTTNKRVFAIGDAKGGLMFTHLAGYDAGIVIRNILFKLPTKANYSAIPWVTYTDPELSQVGLTEAQAKERYGDAVKVVQWEYAENDRARAERITSGLIKVVAGKRGKILGAGIAGTGAGEIIQPWQIAVAKGYTMADMTGIISPYPTLSEISKRAAGSYFTDRLFSPRTRKIVRLLLKL